jgi:hypothetical protein
LLKAFSARRATLRATDFVVAVVDDSEEKVTNIWFESRRQTRLVV